MDLYDENSVDKPPCARSSSIDADLANHLQAHGMNEASGSDRQAPTRRRARAADLPPQGHDPDRRLRR